MWHFKKKANEILENEDGYTLLELLVVLVIITLIVGLVAPGILEQFGSSKEKTAEIEARRLITDLEFFFVDVGRFPTGEEGLGALTSGEGIDGWSGPYVSQNTTLEDPWGNAYNYTNNGTTITISSNGIDGTAGGTDDISISRNATGF